MSILINKMNYSGEAGDSTTVLDIGNAGSVIAVLSGIELAIDPFAIDKLAIDDGIDREFNNV